MSENQENSSRILIYNPEGGATKVSVKLEGNTVWLSQADMAELFQTSPQNITMHIKSIVEDGELFEDSTCKDYLQVRREGQREIQRTVKHYNLEMVIAVGYRIRSHRGTHFRRWATERLNEYLVKGFTLDDERLKGVLCDNTKQIRLRGGSGSKTPTDVYEGLEGKARRILAI